MVMRFRLPLIALWLSLLYLLLATAVTGKLLFDQLRVFNRGAATASEPMQFVNPAWVIQEADMALSRLWWMCSAIGFGILLLAASTVWVSLIGSGSFAQMGITTPRLHD